MADAPYVGPNLGSLAPSGTPSGVQFIPDAPVGGKFIPDAPQAQTAQPAFIPDDHPHAVDAYGEAEEVAIRAEPIEGRIEDHVRRTFEGYPQIQSDVALWGVGDLVERKP